ncbi:actin-associated protein FAM107A [Denticeps clupeoides]|uniref:Actin-associated protein FAM107A n=1 Tax=Denticeps clupeoides TaxID=299321 RepID=A0AAY4CGG2_9TELE|nr:actin-associated protein FAM107A-like [Denticeps clupeoides]
MGVTHGKKTDNNFQQPCSDCNQPLIRSGPDHGQELEQHYQQDECLKRRRDPGSPQTQHSAESECEELIRPKKIINPVKASSSHQALHRELLQSHRRPVMEEKSELQRALEQRNRRLLVKQRREEELCKKTTPLQQELLKRQQRLDTLEKQLDDQEEKLNTEPEFIRVKESLRRTTSLV